MASQMKVEKISQHLEAAFGRTTLSPFLLLYSHLPIVPLDSDSPPILSCTHHLSSKIAIMHVSISLTPIFALTLFPFSRLPSSSKKPCPFSVPAFLHRSAIDTIMNLYPRPVPRPSRPLMGQTCSCPAPTHPVFDTWLSMREWRQFPLSGRRWSSDGV